MLSCSHRTQADVLLTQFALMDVDEPGTSRGGSSSGEETEIEVPPLHIVPPTSSTRNLIAFWFLGLCNNFAYVVMLSAAKDILDADHSSKAINHCQKEITTRACFPQSTGAVLLADILPSLVIKMLAPFFVHKLPFGMRHLMVVLLQASSYLLVATSGSFQIALFGVLLASLGSGLGETSYLALASFFPIDVISSWSSGTGGAGVVGASVYALMTDRRLLGLSPSTALLTLLLIVPTLFSLTFWIILELPVSVQRVRLTDPRTFIVHRYTRRSIINEEEPLIEEEEPLNNDDDDAPKTKWQMIRPLLQFMVPLIAVYLAEYMINQGLLELQLFTCAQAFDMDPDSQYRWFQVLYQIGVFISRSSARFVQIPARALPVLAILQVFNAVALTVTAVHQRIPHILIAMGIILYEGLLGGAAYVNTYRATYQTVKSGAREFSMAFVAMSDCVGIVCAGFAAIPLHNYICSLPL